MRNFRSIKTGNLLERKERVFHWEGRWFSGLVDVETNSLYDDPEDSFCAAFGSVPCTAIEEVKIQ